MVMTNFIVTLRQTQRHCAEVRAQGVDTEEQTLEGNFWLRFPQSD